MCSFLDKLTTKYNKIFQLHLNNICQLLLPHWNGTTWMFVFIFKVCTKIILTKTKPFNRQIVIIQMSYLTNKHTYTLLYVQSAVLCTGTNTCPQPWHSLMLMTLCLNSAQTEINRFKHYRLLELVSFGSRFKYGSKFNHTVWLIYPRLCTLISIKICWSYAQKCFDVFFYTPQSRSLYFQEFLSVYTVQLRTD